MEKNLSIAQNINHNFNVVSDQDILQKANEYFKNVIHEIKDAFTHEPFKY